MIIKKKFNNNVLMTTDKEGNEIVLIGNGLAFNSRPGELVDEEKIEKIFRMESTKNADSFADFLINISKSQLELIEKIIEYGEEKLEIQLNKYLYLSLNDHIENALERHKAQMDLTNPLLWEIKKIYPKEFEIAAHALELIEEKEGISLLEDEAGFIALHFVNAQQKQEKMHQTMQIPKIVKDILSIVEYHFSIELSKDSLSYERFLVHLKFFAHRAVTHADFPNSNISMLKQLAATLPKTYACVEKINQYMQENHGIEISDDEKFYLMVHLQRVTEN
ncbi:BglG family transcription antiterminator LicT [Enterococcus hulanensis]|uniref:BglG family transcription antiterminator LicT n=1 Tax=Enterococcus hulanensis TaxID=2559929 RepID=UPI00201776AC|nr:PRD domain-containing protein [Enterococcus hulanensis]